ncbi:hypothetical protein GCM10007392_31080 [Saccharospirillum salsuginis]|uniref:Uncharacterized protein n=1 Tax=Saccharospirillum salsuginis TaxID=418750 RepID=A0A918NDX8_9GAMM|nr:hypothetical protein GCM10007392_31080 [Saccharospirillum salsuginis]
MDSPPRTAVQDDMHRQGRPTEYRDYREMQESRQEGGVRYLTEERRRNARKAMEQTLTEEVG